MANIFGFEITRKSSDKPKIKTLDTPIRPEEEGSALQYRGHGAYGETFNVGGIDYSSEQELIRKYRKLAMMPEIETAIEEIINEAVVTDENKPSVDVAFADKNDISDNIKKRITEEFSYIYNLLDFNDNGYEYFRSWYVDGRLAFYKNVDKKNKTIGSIQQIDPQKIRRVKEIIEDKEVNNVPLVTDINVYYEYNRSGLSPETLRGTNQTIQLTNDSVTYATSGLLDDHRKYALSYLHKALKSINQLSALEDSMVIYRITRAPERRIFYIDVGTLPRQKAEQYVMDIMSKYRNKMIYNPNTGQIDDTKKYQTMLEDYFLPRREGGKGTQVDTLAGGQTTNVTEELEYFLRKVYKSLNVPFSRFNDDQNMAFTDNASSVTREELKFARFIQRLRRRFSIIFYDLLKTQCLVKGVFKEHEWNDIKDQIFFNFTKDSWFAEAKNLDILNARLGALSSIENYVGTYYSQDYVSKKILNQSTEERVEQYQQIQREKEAGLIPSEEEM